MKRNVTRALGGLAALGASLLFVGEAQAGTYVIRSCNVPGHATAPVIPWQASPVSNMVAFNTCAKGGGFGFTFPGEHRMDAYAKPHYRLVEPAAIEVRRVRLWLIARLTGAGSPLYAPTFAVNEASKTTLHDFRPPGLNTLARPIDDTLTQERRGYRVSLACAGYGGNESSKPDCVPDSNMPLEVRGAEVTLAEGLAPVGSVTGGSLFADGSVSGVRGLDFSASDAGSGVRTIEAIVGGSVLATRDLAGSCSYADFAACPRAAGGSLGIDTRRVPDGVHPVILRMTDAAGNQDSVQVQLVKVRNASPPPAAVAPAASSVSTAKLTARFARTKRSSRVLRFGRKIRLRGRLSDASKAGIGGARIDVLQRTRVAGSRERRVGTIKTRSNGRFFYRRRARGSSRTMRLVYRPEGGAPAAKSRKLKVRVRGAARLRVSLRGRMLRFRGRVVSRPLPRRGKRVRLQGKAPGYEWSTFARKRTDRKGRFSGRYRLPVRRPGVRIAIRVHVPGERGYSYLSYRGRAKRLRVR